MLVNVMSARLRPYLILGTVVVVFTLLDRSNFFGTATVYSSFQMFAAFGLVALGLGLTMIIGEFDLSVAGVYGLAGCVAVLAGNENATLGIACAVLVGAFFGFLQGVVVTKLSVGSVPVTLGGLLTATGCAYVVTQNDTLSFDNMELALALNDQVAGVFSPRSLVSFGIFLAVAITIFSTRLGRDLIATGSDRRAAMTSGVPVDRIVIGTFMFSGALAAISGALLSYGLASAAPTGLSEVMVPAIAATILGGVSLSGGVGTPLGIAAGVLTLTVLRSGLNALSAPPWSHQVATGLVLVAVAVADAPYLSRAFRRLRILLGTSHEMTSNAK